ncbi:MAG: Alkaline phosphatase PafA [Haliscomenobacter sp.]|jgi:predicted AlkP superfamily pyrophosphatase or phosphodiesterase|nr:Alkaline phosphatase PafA [Haliscomenobacter sp.]
MKKWLLFLGLSGLMSGALPAQTDGAKPRLVVGITVDQMRYDYLYKYYDKYGSGGFKRLLNDGFSCENTHYNYMPTYTAPGHASIYTGTTPSVHGVVGNDWYDRSKNRTHYVTADETVKGVGTDGANGKHSPSVLLASTITDELRLSNAMQSKVVGVCIKDRGSILPAGHIPNACYWFDDANGYWVSSNYYPDTAALPGWVQKFNEKNLALRYLSEPWNTVEPERTYTESHPEWDKYENRFSGDTTGAFPHVLPANPTKGGPGLVRATPFGNTLTTDFALTVIKEMRLGEDAIPDFLALSYSSTDYVGHQFGIHSKEVQDTYMRLDRDLQRLLDYLDEKIGNENILVFLTADHGAAETVPFLKDIRIPTGILEERQLVKDLNTHLESVFGVRMPYVNAVINQQVYVNEQVLPIAKLEAEPVRKAIVAYLSKVPGIRYAVTKEELFTVASELPFIELVRRGFHPKRSGDVIFHLEPAWLPEPTFANGGTTHGSPYAYDTHVPLVWYGWNVPKGKTYHPVSITDIAPTLAAMLRIMEPNGCTGKVIVPLLER